MTKISPNFFKYLTMTTASLGIYNTASNYHTNRTWQTKYDIAVKNYMELQNNLLKWSEEKYIESAETKAELVKLKEQLDQAQMHMESARTAAENLLDSGKSGDYLEANKNSMSDNLDKVNNNFDSIRDWVNARGGFKFTSDNNSSITDLINSFNDLFNSDNLIQQTAVANILGCLFIFFCLLSFIGIFYGNKLLDKFQIVEKYPRLKRFLELRTKFQQYYLLTDIILIMCILLGMCYINFLMFLEF